MKKEKNKLDDREVAIRAENISKAFRIPHEKHTSLKAATLNVFEKKTYEEFVALKGVSFEVKKGEFFGIIGRNGSGKSTLLKILAGIYMTDEGKVEVNGKLSPFLELGVGFNPELTARENVFLGGAILGLARKEIEEKFDEIIKFSELEEFVDMKFKNFSSGMQVKLAFSLSIHAHADILLMDEVLAVGDTNFQNKCIEEFVKYKEQGKTVLLVSHDIETIKRYCEKAILLRNGKIVSLGKANVVGNEYIYQNIEDEESKVVKKDTKKMTEEIGQHKKSRRKAEIIKVDFRDKNGKIKNIFETGEDIVARIQFMANEVLEKPVFGVAIHTQDGIHVAGPNTKTSGYDIDEIKGQGTIDFLIKHVPLFSGTYYFTVAIYNWECITPFDYQDKKYVFKIRSTERNQNGIIKLETSWKR